MIGSDEAIMMTNDEATNSKRSAIHLGYWKDDFIDFVARGSHHLQRKTPEINRGYFCRVFAINQIVNQFLDAVNEGQIVNLGSGFDSLFWRLTQHSQFKKVKHFVDVDLPGVTSRKLMHIRNSSQLISSLGEDIKFNSLDLHSIVYHLISADLRSTSNLEAKLLSECHLETSIPTLFIAECVLIYMSVPDSNHLLSWISSLFLSCVFLNYEQVNMFDRFGQIMIENLKVRNCELLDLEPCRSLETQKKRFVTTGWNESQAWDMLHIYKFGIPQEEVRRIEMLEFLDEENLLDQLLSHYCLSIGYKNTDKRKIGF